MPAASGARRMPLVHANGIDIHYRITGEGSETVLLNDLRRGIYKKLVISDGRLTGAVLVGDVADALWYLELIRNRQPIARIRSEMMFGRALAVRSEAA